MSVPEIGRTKDAGWELGGPARDPFPPDEVAEEGDTTGPGGSPGSRSTTVLARGV